MFTKRLLTTLALIIVHSTFLGQLVRGYATALVSAHAQV